jgi:hypothetical protein
MSCGVRFEVFTEVVMMVFRLLVPCRFVSEKHSLFVPSADKRTRRQNPEEHRHWEAQNAQQNSRNSYGSLIQDEVILNHGVLFETNYIIYKYRLFSIFG